MINAYLADLAPAPDLSGRAEATSDSRAAPIRVPRERSDGFEGAFYYRQPETTFCQTQLTEFFRLAEAAARCIDMGLEPYVTAATVNCGRP